MSLRGVRRLLGQYERTRFKVATALSTGSCLEFFAGEQADLLLLDCSMPAEDGLSFLRRAVSVVDLPPTIIITGQSDYGLAAEAIRCGATDVIFKHAMTSQSLGRAVQQALAKSRHEAELSQFDAAVFAAFARAAALVTPGADRPRIASLARSLGQAMGLNDHQLANLRLGAVLHDVGHLGLTAELMGKSGPLSPAERQVLELHPSSASACASRSGRLGRSAQSSVTTTNAGTAPATSTASEERRSPSSPASSASSTPSTR